MSDVSSDCHRQLCHRSSPPLSPASIEPRQESDARAGLGRPGNSAVGTPDGTCGRQAGHPIGDSTR